jgi:hypothetical protein
MYGLCSILIPLDELYQSYIYIFAFISKGCTCHDDIATTIEILIICPVKERFMNSCSTVCSVLVVCQEGQYLLDLDTKLVKKKLDFSCLR